jgi:hypothetical protein
MTTRLPVVLENLRIASPCTADWDEMLGDERVRFCGQCERNVYNLSEMSRAEAEALVGRAEGRMCVRLYQRADGTVLTSDCPVGARRQRLRHRVWASLSGAVASAALFLGLAGARANADLEIKNGKRPHVRVMMGAPPPAPPPQIKMGDVAAPEPLQGEIAILPSPQPKHILMGKVRMDPVQPKR